MTRAARALPLSTAQAVCFAFQIQRQPLLHPLVEQRDRQTAAFLEPSWMLTEGFVAHDQANQLTSVFALL
jgi:hypothetical protein